MEIDVKLIRHILSSAPPDADQAIFIAKELKRFQGIFDQKRSFESQRRYAKDQFDAQMKKLDAEQKSWQQAHCEHPVIVSYGVNMDECTICGHRSY